MGLQPAACMAVTMLLTSGTPAAAQDPSSSQRLRVEFGAVASAGGPGEPIGLGGRIGASANDRSGFEVTIEWTDLGRTRRYVDQIVWFYSIQGRRTIRGRHSTDSSAFFTVGVTGWAERTTTRQEGLTTIFLPPFLPTAGVGWQHRANSHAAIRAELQTVWLFGGRFAAAPRFLMGGAYAVP